MKKVNVFYYSAWSSSIRDRLIAAKPMYVIPDISVWPSIPIADIAACKNAGITMCAYIPTGGMRGFIWSVDDTTIKTPAEIKSIIESAYSSGFNGVFFDESGLYTPVAGQTYQDEFLDRYLQAPGKGAGVASPPILSIIGNAKYNPTTADTWVGLTVENYISYAKNKGMFVIVNCADDGARASRINSNIFPIIDMILTTEDYNVRAVGLAPAGQEISFTSKCCVLSYGGTYDAAATNAAINYGFGAAYCCASMSTLPSPAFENYMAAIVDTVPAPIITAPVVPGYCGTSLTGINLTRIRSCIWEDASASTINTGSSGWDGTITLNAGASTIAPFIAAARAANLPTELSIYLPWGDAGYIRIFTDAATQAKAILTMIALMNLYGFDAFNFDIECDNMGGATAQQITNFYAAVYAALPAGKYISAVENGSPIKVVMTSAAAQYFRWLGIMTYDTGGTDANGYSTWYGTPQVVQDNLNAWANAGFPKNKLWGGITYAARNKIGDSSTWYSYSSVLSANPSMTADMNGIDDRSFNGATTVKQKCDWVKNNGFGGMFTYMTQGDKPTDVRSLSLAVANSLLGTTVTYPTSFGYYGTVSASNMVWNTTDAAKLAAMTHGWLWLQSTYPYSGVGWTNSNAVATILKNAGKKIIFRCNWEDGVGISGVYANWDQFVAGGNTAYNIAANLCKAQINNVGLANIYAITLNEEEPAVWGGTVAHAVTGLNAIAALLRTAFPGIKIIGSPSGGNWTDAQLISLDMDGLLWYTYEDASDAAVSTFLDRGKAIVSGKGWTTDKLYTIVCAQTTPTESWAPDSHIGNITDMYNLCIAKGYSNIGFYTADEAGATGNMILSNYTPDSGSEWLSKYRHQQAVFGIIGVQTVVHTLPASRMKATWVWQISGPLIRSIPDQSNLVRVCTAAGINTLNLYCDQTQLVNEAAGYKALITRLHGLNMFVYGVINGTSVSLASYQTLIAAYLGYNVANPTAMFDGFVFDIEPALTGAAKISALTTFIQSVKAYSSAGQTIRGQNRVVAAYLDAPYYLASPVGDVTQVAAAKILYNEFDLILLNNYEDILANEISHAADGPSTCRDLGICFMLGFESGELSTTPNQNTLWEEGKAGWLALMAQVDANYTSWPMYRGTHIDQWAFLNLWYMIESVTKTSQGLLAVHLMRADHYSSDVIGIKLTIGGLVASAVTVLDCTKSILTNSVLVELTANFVLSSLTPGTYTAKVEVFDMCKNSTSYPRASLLLPNTTQAVLQTKSMDQVLTDNLTGTRNPPVLLDTKSVSVEVTMATIVFPPNAAKLAKVPVTVSPSGVACALEAFVGPTETQKLATSGPIAFTSTGAVQNVNCPITMPVTSTVMHAYIDLTSGGILVQRFVDMNMIAILSGSVDVITWS